MTRLKQTDPMPGCASTPRLLTLGCRLNGYESQAMRRLGAEAGLGDAVIVNSCAVTNEAVRRTRQTIRRARRESPSARIVVTGCAAQIDPDVFAAMPEVDAVLGNAEKLNAQEWRRLAKEKKTAAPSVRVNDIMAVRDTAGHLVDGYGDRARAFVQVQTGCDHRCTFCVIPYGRGNARSVPLKSAAAEAARLTDAGHRELVLTGVDITSYGADLPGAPDLGHLVDVILEAAPSLYRLRLSSIDVAEISDALFDRIAGDERIAPHMHLSLQAGDNMVLKRMKRRHTREQAIEFCQRLKAARPEIAFGADIIAGFPTETDAMFANTLAIIEEAGLHYLHVFPFSPREGTPAARMPQVARHIVKARAARLRDAGDAAHRAFLDHLVGRCEDAIVESGGRARLGNFAEITFDGPAASADLSPGAVARVEILSRRDKKLVARAA